MLGIAKSRMGREIVALSFTTQPDGAVTAVQLTQQPVVKKLVNGVVDAGFTGNVTLAVKYGSGSLSGTVTVAAVAGVATFTNVVLTGAGGHVLEATASGCRPARSGRVTVVAAATAAKTVLAFTLGSTNAIDCGSGANLDNLTASNMTVGLRVKRTSNGGNQFLISKDKTFGEGWYVQFDNTNGEGTILCGALTTGTEARSFSNSSNLAASGTWYDLFCEWVASSKTWKIYLTATGTASAEVSGYNGQTAGTGSMVSDAAAKVFIGYLEAAANLAPGAAIEWAVVFSKGLTAAERLQVQLAWDINDKTRAAAAVNAVGSVAMLHRLDATGTLTDLSGNGNTGTVTGASTTTGETVYTPTVWGETVGNPTDLTSILDPGSHAKLKFTTSATSVIVGAERKYLTSSTNDNQAAIAFEVSGAYDSQVTVAAVGRAYATRSLPAGANKAVSIINSPSFRSGSPSSSGDTFGVGAGVISLRFNNTTSEVIPATPSRTVVILSDSILDGFLQSPVGSNGPIDTLRAYCAGNPQIIAMSYGGRSLYGSGFDSTLRTTLVQNIARTGATDVLINLGVVDYGDGGGLWSAASFETAYTDFLQKLVAELPTARIIACTMVTMGNGEGANTNFSNTATQYRTAISNSVAAVSGVRLIAGPTQLWDGTNAAADSLHPNNTGAAAILANLKTILGV